jgi:hypothetical protein
MKIKFKHTESPRETIVVPVMTMTAEEKAIVDKFKDKIYFKKETILGIQDCINLRTVYSIAIRAGLDKPYVTRQYDDEDNCIMINFQSWDFTEDAEEEVLGLYRFCKSIKS